MELCGRLYIFRFKFAVIWWVALLVFKIPSGFFNCSYTTRRMDGWMTCGVYSDARRRERWRWGLGVAMQGMRGIWNNLYHITKHKNLLWMYTHLYLYIYTLMVIPTPTNMEPPPALPRRYICIYTHLSTSCLCPII